MNRDMREYQNYIGEIYGELTVIAYEGKKWLKTKNREIPMMKCKCSCGNEKVVSLWDLKSGKTKTCAYNHPHFLDRTLPAFNQIYEHSYKRRALKQGIEFSISKDDFRTLTKSNCYYCGKSPENSFGMEGTAKLKSGKYISVYVYNGLDRKDHTKGYTLDNVVPCCYACNHAKRRMSHDEFIGWLDAIMEYRMKINRLTLVN